ncbi:protease inhibitor/seed storage/LTP family protein, partial [Vibrio parahaemolyticus]|nr:protease inhibitor/seed storage/LTP family protein [Vibrio parahaemolyticus]
SDINQDKAECTDKLLGLAGCLPYVGGEAKVPTMDCCSGIKEVINKSKRCLCILIKDRDDPSLGLKINVTLALNLPDVCETPTNITQCV